MQTLPMLMQQRLTLMPMLRPRQLTPTTPAQPRVTQPQQPPIPWDSLLEFSRPVALHPPSKARPTTYVATPGSAQPMAQTVFITVWCLVPEASSSLLLHQFVLCLRAEGGPAPSTASKT